MNSPREQNLGSQAQLAQAFMRVREHSLELAAPLSEEDCCAQSMPDASPAKWHLAHTSWFFETFLLEAREPGFRPFRPEFRVLFNSYYNGVGEKHPRPQRGLLTRPSLAEVKSYRASVDERMLALLERLDGDGERAGGDAALASLVELGLQHEQQHQELLLTDVKHLFSLNPLLPAYREAAGATHAAAAPSPLEWIASSGGRAEIGHVGAGFCFDNETPRHAVLLAPFELASRLVSNAEYRAFVEDGGYREPAHWLSDGWDWVQANRIEQPLYWQRSAAGWREFDLGGAVELDPHRPVCAVSYYEADAYARWAGARLPSEFEWEHAAREPRSAHRFAQLFDSRWQWTQSSYAPYPGFRPAAGAVGEYNGKFMVNQYVLRGSSCATPSGHARASYRNFFPAAARWQFSGIRLARDVG
jgi:ergothioneine biosynthesis protein EgtB